MTDAHCHIVRGEGRAFLASPFDSEPREGDVAFFGFHPWDFLNGGELGAEALAELKRKLVDNPCAGVGEIGLDRLKVKTVPDGMRRAFREQLALAAELGRPTVLHGAKCWGETLRECLPHAGRIPAFLFHGFSRSGGLLPDIAKLNGFISVGPAIMNSHAVNYHELVKAIPENMILVESDATSETAADMPPTEDIAKATAAARGVSAEDFAETLERNATRFATGAKKF